jgi:hypothetical protein
VANLFILMQHQLRAYTRDVTRQCRGFILIDRLLSDTNEQELTSGIASPTSKLTENALHALNSDAIQGLVFSCARVIAVRTRTLTMITTGDVIEPAAAMTAANAHVVVLNVWRRVLAHQVRTCRVCRRHAC